MNTHILVALTVLLISMWLGFYAFAKSSPQVIKVDLEKVSISVKDGDTFVIKGKGDAGNKIVRIFGIDANEKDQVCWGKDGFKFDCAEQARKALLNILSGKNLVCIKMGQSYDRIVMQCSVDNMDIGKALVRSGLVFEDKRYSKGLYTQDQDLARSEDLGVWSQNEEEIVFPWDWRKSRKNR